MAVRLGGVLVAGAILHIYVDGACDHCTSESAEVVGSRPSSSGSDSTLRLEVKRIKRARGAKTRLFKVLRHEKTDASSEDGVEVASTQLQGQKRALPSDGVHSSPEKRLRRTPPETPPPTQAQGDLDVTPGTVEMAATQEMAQGNNKEARMVAARTWVGRELPDTKTSREKMVKMAFELGNSQVLTDLRRMLRSWRRRPSCLLSFTHGRINREEMVETEAGRPWLCGIESAKHFVALWDRTMKARATDYLQETLYRLNMADLHEQYMKLHTRTRSKDKMKASTITAGVMFGWLYGDAPRDAHTCGEFARVIKYAKRWSRFRKSLGPGMMGLIPKTLTRTFVEQTGTDADFNVWLDMVRRFNSSACDLAPGVWQILERALAGTPLLTGETVLERSRGDEIDIDYLGKGWLEVDVAIPNTQLMANEEVELFFDELLEAPELSSPAGGLYEEEGGDFFTHTQDLGIGSGMEAESMAILLSQGDCFYYDTQSARA